MTVDPILIESILEAMQHAPNDPGTLLQMIAENHGAVSATELAHALDVAATAMEGMFKRDGRAPRASIHARLLSADVRAMSQRLQRAGQPLPTCAELAATWAQDPP